MPGLLEIEVGVDLGHDHGNDDVMLTSLLTDTRAPADCPASDLHREAPRGATGWLVGRVAVDHELPDG